MEQDKNSEINASKNGHLTFDKYAQTAEQSKGSLEQWYNYMLSSTLPSPTRTENLCLYFSQYTKVNLQKKKSSVREGEKKIFVS